ncbi:MAG: type II secretion system protein [Alphaproteobacteria bacterium]|nr:type II secretion system protein [Alphaproteobacteria bacterium]
MISIPDKYKRNAGYTLVELAIVLTVVGLVATPLLAGYTQWQKKKADETTVVTTTAYK